MAVTSRSRRAAAGTSKAVCRPRRRSCGRRRHVGDVGGGGGEDQPRPGRRRRCGRVEGDRDQVGALAHRDRRRRRPSPARRAAVAAATSSAAVKWPRCSVASRSSSSTPRASSNRSITAWLSLPRLSGEPASAERRAGPDAVGQVAFGGGAEADAGAAAAEELDVAVGQVGGVHGGGVRPEHAVPVAAARWGCSRARPGTARSRRAARRGGRAAAASPGRGRRR